MYNCKKVGSRVDQKRFSNFEKIQYFIWIKISFENFHALNLDFFSKTTSSESKYDFLFKFKGDQKWIIFFAKRSHDISRIGMPKENILDQ